MKDFGAFVDIGADSNFLLHKTQIKDSVFVRDAGEWLKVGDEITVRIRSKDEAKGRIELSMLMKMEVLMPMQRGQRLADMREGQELGGKITGVRQFGCFVDIGAEADGLIHIRNINDGIVNDIDSVLRPTDPVVVRVIGMYNGKLELALASPLARLPAVDAFLDVASHIWLDATMVGSTQFGIFVVIMPLGSGPQVTALLGMRETKADKMLAKGDKIRVRVLEVDVKKKQVSVTMKEPIPPEGMSESELKSWAAKPRES